MERDRKATEQRLIDTVGEMIAEEGFEKLGVNAIAATTIAVEKVVLIHLEHQIVELQGKDDNAVKAISSIVEEEKEHHDHFTVKHPALKDEASSVAYGMIKT